MKSGNLNFLEPSGPLQACNGTALHASRSMKNNGILSELQFCGIHRQYAICIWSTEQLNKILQFRIWRSVDRASWHICVIRTNKMHKCILLVLITQCDSELHFTEYRKTDNRSVNSLHLWNSKFHYSFTSPILNPISGQLKLIHILRCISISHLLPSRYILCPPQL